MGNQLAIVNGDNWQDLYINDELIASAHKFSISDIMDYVLYKFFDRYEEFDIDQEWVKKVSFMPIDLKKVHLACQLTVAEFREQ